MNIENMKLILKLHYVFSLCYVANVNKTCRDEEKIFFEDNA